MEQGKVMLVLGAAVASCGGGPGAKEPPPDVVLVVADTLRADYLGCYGFDGDVSPNLDRLAQEAVLFEACFSQAPWTKPAVASLFTSLYPQTHGVLTHDGMFAERGGGGPAEEHVALETDVLPGAARTLAELLAAAGYATQAFVTNPWIRSEHGFAQGFEGFDESLPRERSTQEVLEAAAEWVRSYAEERPFFLYLHLMEVHGPYDSPEADWLAVQGAPGLGESRPLTARDRRRLPEYLLLPEWTARPEADDRRTWRGRYAAGVRSFDRRLARFLESLRAADRLESTLLVVTSDHGEELLEHGSWDHGSSLHEHQLHVPLIVRAPGTRWRAGWVGTPVELVDLAPTILEAAGAPAAGLQGRSLWPWLDGREVEIDRASVATGVKWKPGLVSLRTPTHRLILDTEAGAAQGSVRLYDLEQDPGEQRDLAPSRPALVRELLAALLERVASIESTAPLVGQRAAVSAELRSKLEDLGYF